MRRPFGASLRIGVSSSGVALVMGNRFKREQLAVLAEAHVADAGFDTIAAAIGALLADAACDGWPVTFVVADGLARMWQVAPPPAAARMADLEAACAYRFQNLYGEAPLGWRIAADYDPLRPFMAAALPRQLLALLEQLARTHRLVTLETVPQFVAGYNRWRKLVKPDAWYGLVHDGVLSLGAGGALRALALNDAADAHWLAAQLEREALRLNVPAPARLLASGAVPPEWTRSALCQAVGMAGDWSPAVRLAATGSAL